MHTTLDEGLQDDAAARAGKEIVARCVHCGFCNATCPTYQLLGDELDGPRGRIYLIRQVLEGAAPSAKTQLHLDRCLTCRACETTCPSGVEYGRLLDIGRALVEERVARGPRLQALRVLLRKGLTSPLFAPALRLGQALRPLLPARLANAVPARQLRGSWPTRAHARRMLLLAGCVQPSLLPDVNPATARVLDALGIELQIAPGAGCCGAIRQHLGEHGGALEDARRNIDAWWPAIEAGAEALVMNASGCGALVREYGHLLRDDPRYAEKAARVAAMTRDLAEVLAPFAAALPSIIVPAPPERIVFHPPCTLQHALRLRGVVEPLLQAAGAELLSFADSHLCCGSAGTYSILQPQIAGELRRAKLAALLAPGPALILSANVGCIAHLGSSAGVPVRHWIEWLAARLPS